MIRIGFRHRGGAIVATHRLDTGLHLAPVLQVVGSPPDVGALRLGLGDHGDRRRAGANALRRHRSRRNEGAARAGQAREQQQGERACHKDKSVQVCSSQWFLVVSQGGAQKKRVCKLETLFFLPTSTVPVKTDTHFCRPLRCAMQRFETESPAADPNRRARCVEALSHQPPASSTR